MPMRDTALREVLLVKAVEESDPRGQLLPLADREAATREAARTTTSTAQGLGIGETARLEAFVTNRTERLFGPLAERHPSLRQVVGRSDVPPLLTLLVLIASFASGMGMSALDGSKRIDILALPFLGVVAWNLVVYLALASISAARLASRAPGEADPGSWLGHFAAPRLGRLLVRLPNASTDIADALARFAADFGRVASELLTQHAKRLMHLAAAALAAGLAVGLYMRGIVLQYDAGWESTFLGPAQVREVLGVLFGPLAAVAGIELPQTVAATEALRWQNGGVDAAPWIHLIALALLLYVIVPRLLLAGGSWLRGLRLRRSSPMPASLVAYASSLLGTTPAARFPARDRVVNLSLISHTNVGKTTLARTLLHRSVGEVRDEEHVTTSATAYEIVATSEGDLLQLWDTPGFGDSVRLAGRLERSGAPIGWFLSRVWDRWTDREFYLDQLAVRNVREQADAVLYMVDASEDPAGHGYLDAEMRILGWMGKPVVVLLNQLGPPGTPEQEREVTTRWARRMAAYPCVRATLAFDAFARCWVQESTLVSAMEAVMPIARRDAWARLATAWQSRNETIFVGSAAALSQQLATIACDSQPVPQRGMAGAARDLLGKLGGESRGPVDVAMKELAQRSAAHMSQATAQMLALHGLSGNAAAEIETRVATDFSVDAALDHGQASLLGAAVSGAIGGLAADLAAGGLTFGVGALIGGLLGAAGARGLAMAYNQVRGTDSPSVRWSDDFMGRLVTSSLLRYLAVAHFGRGRGDFVASEYPQHWRGIVEEEVAREASGLQETWHSAISGATEDSLAASLRPRVDRILRSILARLYGSAGT
jgi:hypothetical protein